jgi:nucleoside-diphosphate-sugar epimerase
MVGYAGRKILVTGGTGFVGGRLAERLAFEEHAKVRVLVHRWSKAVWVSRANVELVHGDVTDPDLTAKAMQDCEIVFHCVGVGGTHDHCTTVNIEGTRNVLKCAADAGVGRVVYLSSIAVHGPNPPNNADEQDEFRFTGAPYGDSKVMAERLVWQFWQEHKLPVVVVRPTFVWGPRSAGFTLSPVNHMKSGRWFLVDGGQGTCHAVYIDNLIDAILLAGVSPGAVGEAFLITDGMGCTWAEFFGHYARMLGVRKLPSLRSDVSRFTMPVADYINRTLARSDYIPAHEPARILIRSVRWGLRATGRWIFPLEVFDSWELLKYGRRGQLNTSKAGIVLGYVPRFSLAEGMRETEAWLRDQRVI